MPKSLVSAAVWALCFPLLLSSCTQGSTPTAQTSPPADSPSIPLGIALSQTSNVALVGQEQVSGVKIAETYFNGKGGVGGTPIQLKFQDVGSEEATAINAFQSLINQDKVVGIVGPTLSQQAFSADPIADRAGVPVLAPSNTAAGIPEIGKFISRVSASVAVVAPNALKMALKINPQIKTVGVFYAQNDAFSNSETKIFQQTVKDLNLDLVTVQRFQTTDTDFQAQASSTIRLQPDLVIISGLAADAANLVRQLRELGYKGLIIGGNGFNTANIFAVCQARCDGILVTQAYSPDHVSPINTAFRAAYRQQFQKDPPQFTAQAFTAVQVFVEALQALNQRTQIKTLPLAELRSQLNAQILKGKYDTPLGEISFTPEGEIIQKTFYVARLKMAADGKTGKFVFLK
jgi:branched-chain amino acid transport system substrate-binding protein